MEPYLWHVCVSVDFTHAVGLTHANKRSISVNQCQYLIIDPMGFLSRSDV